MAIVFSSDSHIEALMKAALQAENLSFIEQYRVYEKPGDTDPKYVLDFLVTDNGRSVVVECDGYSYHSSDIDVDYDIMRDQWLKAHGYYPILRFTSYQIKNEMNTVLLNIKHRLGIVDVPKSELSFRGITIRKDLIVNTAKRDLYRVDLYLHSMQAQSTVWVVYKYCIPVLSQIGGERIKIYKNVPEKLGVELALFTALKDLKKSVELHVFCSSDWLSKYYNKTLNSSSAPSSVKPSIDKLLSLHNYIFQYISPIRNTFYFYNPSDHQFIMEEVVKKCRYIRSGRSGKYTVENAVDFNDIAL